ncbi:hypothetical protein GC174_17445 [bacterium]|nr:hypothetical protein [bacterium]
MKASPKKNWKNQPDLAFVL